MKSKIIHFLNLLFFVKKRYAHLNTFIFSTFLKYSKLSTNGRRNQITIRSKDIKRLKINIIGNENIVEIDEYCVLRNLNILIEGNNNKVFIGKNTQIGGANLVCIGEYGAILVGEGCLFGANIEIRNSDGHSIFRNNKIINPPKSVILRDKIWICENVKILKGVEIGTGSVVGINSLVLRGKYEENSILAGNPARVVGRDISWAVERPL